MAHPFHTELQDSPRLVFQSFQDQFGKTPAMRQFFQGQFDSIYNQFLGRLGADLMGGRGGGRTFQSDLEQPNFFQNQLYQTPPSQRPFGRTSSLAPRTEFKFF
jgi:hypothetical protein